MYRNLKQILAEQRYVPECHKQNFPHLDFQNYILPHIINFVYSFTCYAEKWFLEPRINQLYQGTLQKFRVGTAVSSVDASAKYF